MLVYTGDNGVGTVLFTDEPSINFVASVHIGKISSYAFSVSLKFVNPARIVFSDLAIKQYVTDQRITRH